MSQSGITSIPDSILPGNVPLEFVTDSGTAEAVLNVLNIVGSGGTTVTASGNTITIASGEFNWQVVTSASNPVTLTKNVGYIAKGGTAVNFVLPATAAIGDQFAVKGYGNLWTVSQGVGQSIEVGNVTSTVGVIGSLQATKVSDGFELLCVTANTEFATFPASGNLTIV